MRAARTQLEMSNPMISSAAISEPPDIRIGLVPNPAPVFPRTKYVQEHILDPRYAQGELDTK
jgi:hypothetical protein